MLGGSGGGGGGGGRISDVGLEDLLLLLSTGCPVVAAAAGRLFCFLGMKQRGIVSHFATSVIDRRAAREMLV